MMGVYFRVSVITLRTYGDDKNPWLVPSLPLLRNDKVALEHTEYWAVHKLHTSPLYDILRGILEDFHDTDDLFYKPENGDEEPLWDPLGINSDNFRLSGFDDKGRYTSLG